MTAKTDLQSALDATALAVAMSDKPSAAQRKQVGKDYFKKNFADSASITAGVNISIVGNLVTASADFDYPMSFMALGGIKSFKIGGLSEVDLSNDKKAEVVLVLDYSGSMNRNDKYIRMRDAAITMLNALDASTEDGFLKVGLVPFSAMVHTSMPASYVTQSAAGAVWTGCTQDRKYPHNTGVAAPGSSNDTKWGYIDPGSENTGSKNCSAYATKGLAIVPLTGDIPGLIGKLGAMSPVGNTNIPLGTEFGWNLLDPEAPYTEGAAYTDSSTRKFIVILTDGVQTSRHWGSTGNRSVANGNDNLVETCSGMRTTDITVFAIAYDITATAVTELLKACAPGNYFEPDVGSAEIDAVFKAITKRIKKSTMRLAR